MGAIVEPTQGSAQTLSLDDQIRWRAYEIFVHRGNESGSELDDWLQAESEVLRAQEEKVEEKGS